MGKVANEFRDALSENAAEGTGVSAHLAMKILRDFCAGIAGYASESLNCFLDPGYRVNMGQEWKIVLKATASGSQHVLLRAYVKENTTGFPVTLDRYEDKLIQCKNETVLRHELKKFLKNPSIRETIDVIASQTPSK